MIEVYYKGKKKDDVIGLVDGKRYLTRKKKLWGYLDGKIAKDESGYPLLYLKDNCKITLNEDWEYEEQGYLKDNKIYYRDTDELILSFHKDKKEIHNHLNNKTIYLRGEDIDSLSNLDFFGISAILLELFAGPGPDEGDSESFLDDVEDLLDDLL